MNLDCDNCHGDGETVEPHPKHPSDPQEDITVRCDRCHGTGEAQCEGCGDRAATCTAWVAEPHTERTCESTRRRHVAHLYRICAECLIDYREDGSFIALETPREALVRGARDMRALVLDVLKASTSSDLAPYRADLRATQPIPAIPMAELVGVR